MVVCNSDRIPEIELQYLRALNDHRVDGVIFAGGGLVEDRTCARPANRSTGSARAGPPASRSAGTCSPRTGCLIDNEQLVRDAVAHLAARATSGSPSCPVPRCSRRPGCAWMGIARRWRAGFGRGRGRPGGRIHFEAGSGAAHVIAGMERPADGRLASNDIMAMGCIVGFKGLGLGFRTTSA